MSVPVDEPTKIVGWLFNIPLLSGDLFMSEPRPLSEKSIEAAVFYAQGVLNQTEEFDTQHLVAQALSQRDAELRALRKAGREIMAIACGESQVAANDSDGMKLIYWRLKALLPPEEPE